MKFQWYIVDLDNGTVQGSNDIEEFDDLLDDDQFVILTAQHGKYFNGSRDEVEVEALDLEDDEEEEEGEEDEEEDDEDKAHAKSDAKHDLEGEEEGPGEDPDLDD
jgi:hypothetical protein